LKLLNGTGFPQLKILHGNVRACFQVKSINVVFKGTGLSTITKSHSYTMEKRYEAGVTYQQAHFTEI
jgi:hypothetical protein